MTRLVVTKLPGWHHQPSNILVTAVVFLVDVETSLGGHVSKNGKVALPFSVQVGPGWSNQAIFDKPVVLVTVSSVKHDGKKFNLIFIQSHTCLGRSNSKSQARRVRSAAGLSALPPPPTSPRGPFKSVDCGKADTDKDKGEIYYFFLHSDYIRSVWSFVDLHVIFSTRLLFNTIKILFFQ